MAAVGYLAESEGWLHSGTQKGVPELLLSVWKHLVHYLMMLRIENLEGNLRAFEGALFGLVQVVGEAEEVVVAGLLVVGEVVVDRLAVEVGVEAVVDKLAVVGTEDCMEAVAEVGIVGCKVAEVGTVDY